MSRRLLLVLFVLLVLTPFRGVEAAGRRKATLEVRSTPSGAQVTVDGVARGATPLTIRGLAPGAHALVIARAGYSPVQQGVSLRRGKRKLVKVRLERVTALDRAEKDRRRGAVAGAAAPLGHIGVLNRMFLGSSGFTTGGPLARTEGEATLDPVSGMWVVTSLDFDDAGNLVITVTYYLDEALTEPAGGFTIVADGVNAIATYAFTAGDLAGQSGTLIATVTDLTHVGIQAQGVMPGGWSYTGDFAVVITQSGFTLNGTIVLTDPDGGTTEWQVSMTLDGATFTGTVAGIEVVAHFNADGSGDATLTDASTGDVLALLVWEADGTAIITYSDGTSETFQLF